MSNIAPAPVEATPVGMYDNFVIHLSAVDLCYFVAYLQLEIKSITLKAMQYRQNVRQSAVQRDWSWCTDTSDPRHFGPRQFGTSAEVSVGHFGPFIKC